MCKHLVCKHWIRFVKLQSLSNNSTTLYVSKSWSGGVSLQAFFEKIQKDDVGADEDAD